MSKKNVLIASTAVLLIVVIGLIAFSNKRGDPNSQFADRAQNVIESLEAGNYEDAEEDFHSALKAKMSPQQLGQEWTKAIAICGQLKKYFITRIGATPNSYYSVYLTCQFEKGNLYAVVRFDGAKSITEFQMSGTPIR